MVWCRSNVQIAIAASTASRNTNKIPSVASDNSTGGELQKTSPTAPNIMSPSLAIAKVKQKCRANHRRISSR